jgi:hypothetical protein
MIVFSSCYAQYACTVKKTKDGFTRTVQRGPGAKIHKDTMTANEVAALIAEYPHWSKIEIDPSYPFQSALRELL